MKVGFVTSKNKLSPTAVKLFNLQATTTEYSFEVIIALKQSNIILNTPLNILTSKLFALIKWLDKFILLKLKIHYYDDGYHSFSESNIPVIYLDTFSSAATSKQNIPHDSIKLIKNANLDILILDDETIPSKELSGLSKDGIYGINFNFRNKNLSPLPAGFLPLTQQEKYTSFTIQSFNLFTQYQQIFMTGKIASFLPYLENRRRILRKSIFFLHHFLLNYNQNHDCESLIDGGINHNFTHKNPSILEQLKYIFQLTKFFLQIYRDKIISFFAGNFEWQVAIAKKTVHGGIDENALNVINNIPDHFFADPFLVSFQDKIICCVEDFDILRSKGSIRAFDVSGEKISDLGLIINEKFHLSYPYIFKAHNELFICPESSANRDIRLYKCDEFPNKWSFYKVLKKEISAADTNIFYFNDRWWMFTNIDTSDLNDHSSELHIFHADEFDSHEWVPHTKNPIFVDSTIARNAGFLEDNSNLYRVSQSQGFHKYGESISVRIIKTLTPSDYEESNTNFLSHNKILSKRHTHHLSSTDTLFAFDFKFWKKIKF